MSRYRAPLYRKIVPTLYIIFLMLPIYWLVNMSFKTTNEILNPALFSLWPQRVHARQLPHDLHRLRPGTAATSTR